MIDARLTCMSPRERFLSGLRRGTIDRAPVGSPTSVATLDCMRQSHAFFPDVHLDGRSMASLAATSHTVLGYDCIMPVFSVTQESAALGCTVDWGGVDSMPVGRTHPFARPDELSIPDDFLDRPSIRAVLDAIGILKRAHGADVAIVGKVMGPWTLSYHLHGVQEFLIETILEPDTVRRFLDCLKHVTVLFGRAQLDAGADALCVADHATGDLVSSRCYRDLLLPVHQEITAELGALTVLHICGNTADRLDAICEAGFDAFHFDSKVPPARAVDIVKGRIALVGNVNNPQTLLNGQPEQAYDEAARALRAGVNVAAPECAVPLITPNANLIAIAAAAHNYQPSSSRGD